MLIITLLFCTSLFADVECVWLKFTRNRVASVIDSSIADYLVWVLPNVRGAIVRRKGYRLGSIVVVEGSVRRVPPPQLIFATSG